MTQIAYKHGGIPTAGVIEYRSVLYPISRSISDVRETDHGEVRILKGRLTARHRDYIDAIMANCHKSVLDKAGQLVIVFDDSKIRKVLGIKNSEWDDLRHRLIEIMSTVVQIRRKGQQWPAAFPILTFVGECRTIFTSHGFGKYETSMKKIIMSTGMVSLLKDDVSMYVNKSLINYILGLDHQITRSVVKWLLTHSDDQHHTFKNMLTYVGSGDCSVQMQRQYVRELKEEEDKIKSLGITMTGGLADGKIHSVRNLTDVFIDIHKDQAKPITGG